MEDSILLKERKERKRNEKRTLLTQTAFSHYFFHVEIPNSLTHTGETKPSSSAGTSADTHTQLPAGSHSLLHSTHIPIHSFSHSIV
mmetsp:Transcript_51899/g.101655  ORF Transcript_51899/g.101655 Transcript_51899/m.101655 type:complete len:86 (+) Transcript_51899:1021-1278(+)